MNNKKKQTAVVAMATVLSITTIASPMAVMAQENPPVPPAIMQDENQQQKTAPEIVLPENLQATAGTALEEITLPEHWAWVENSTVIAEKTAEMAEYPARFSVDDVTYDYSDVEGYNEKGHYVERMVTVTVEPAKLEPAEPVQGKSNRSLGDAPTAVNAGDIEINDTNFPDKAFRDWLEQQDYGQDKKITQDEIAGITEINVSGNTNIEDLTGIKHFTALTILYCNNTGISDLDVSKNSKLITLDCYNNGKLANLTVAGATELTILDCNNTGISGLDVSNNTKLTHLFCYDNGKLAKLTVAGATELTQLYCENTGITSLDVSKNTKLIRLDCRKTGITDLDVSKNTKLIKLDCRKTGISDLDVSNNTKLTTLNCYETPLAYLDIGENKGLTVNKSNLTNPTVYVATDTFMLKDKFSGIDITKISNLKGADLNSQTGEVYNFSHGNPITYDYDCGTSINGKETLNVTLTVTNELAINETNFPDKEFRTWLEQQSYGQDKKITQDEIAGITEIKVRNKVNIKDLTGIEYFTSLESLDCYKTGITSLDVGTNTALKKLNCSNTGIESLDVGTNTALENLDCSNTKIESLDVSTNTALTNLHCYSTDIKNLDVSTNTALRNLNCSKTKIKILDIGTNTALTGLNCYNIGIESLDVSKNTALKNLACQSTGITSLNVSTNTALEKLYCNNTGITSLDVSKNTALKYLECPGTTLAYLNIGANNNLRVIKDNLKPVNVEVTGDSFKMADKFAGIDKDKISNVTGATYSDGIMSNYSIGTPITYTYVYGTSDSGAETIDVTLNLIGKSTISITEDLNKTYDGNAVSATPIVDRAGSAGAVSYKWEQKKNANEWVAIASVPTDAGTYKVTATLASDDDYPEATSAPVEFTISQATNNWTDTLSITGWTYGGTANNPVAIAKFGTIDYLYSDSENGTYTDTAPTNAGTWYVKAVVAGTDNYESLESDAVSFVIAPRNATANNQIIVPDITADTNLDELIIKDGDKVLAKGTDYDVDKKQDGNKVTVTITFKDNYTGTITKTYTVASSGGDKDNNKPNDTKPDNQITDDKKVVQTGDNSKIGLLATMSLLSAGFIAFLTGKKRKNIKDN